MKISTKGRYALRVMVELAKGSSGEYIALSEIAARQEISLKYLESIISLLLRAELLRGQRGKKGGYTLSKKSEDYTVAEILRATEGNLAPVACLAGEENPCSRREKCCTLPMWEELSCRINEYLDGITLADLRDGKIGQKRK